MYRELTDWRPNIGDRCSTCYFPLIDDSCTDYINKEGEIIATGINYCIIKVVEFDERILVKSDRYHLIEKFFDGTMR